LHRTLTVDDLGNTEYERNKEEDKD
jgi:hypothetical protein